MVVAAYHWAFRPGSFALAEHDRVMREILDRERRNPAVLANLTVGPGPNREMLELVMFRSDQDRRRFVGDIGEPPADLAALWAELKGLTLSGSERSLVYDARYADRWFISDVGTRRAKSET